MAAARTSSPAAVPRRPARPSSSRARARAARSPLEAPLLLAGPLARIRWDRLGRVALLCVLTALLYLYVSAGVRLFSTWREARSDSAQVQSLEREHLVLLRRHESLARRGTIEEEARRLGMVRPNEQPYIISRLPGN